jgi:hypothetical protein
MVVIRGCRTRERIPLNSTSGGYYTHDACETNRSREKLEVLDFVS